MAALAEVLAAMETVQREVREECQAQEEEEEEAAHSLPAKAATAGLAA